MNPKKRVITVECQTLRKEERENIPGENAPNMRRLHMMAGCRPHMVTIGDRTISVSEGMKECILGPFLG